MMLTRKQFDILALLAEKKCSLSQFQIEKQTGCSSETVNRVIKEFSKLNYVNEGKITNEGLAALEPYRAKRAVFIAAGFGSRLVPITLNTPKPLVRVHGVRIIDRMIDACLEAEINEIYIVRGYLADQFDQLLYKYPMIKFLENPGYNEANNISSGKELYWEQVPLVYKKNRYKVEVRACKDEDIVEIDTFRELKAIDRTYDV